MKTRILCLLCGVLALTCILTTVLLISNVGENNNTIPSPAGSTSDDLQFKLSLLHLYYESNSIVSTLPFTTMQVTESALLKAFASTDSSSTDALAYIDRYSDRTLDSAYKTMDEVLAKYKKILEKYNISSASSYTSKYNSLSLMFDSLRSASTELFSRTRTLIKMCNSNDYDTYYTNYIEQLSKLSDKIEQDCVAMTEEYNSLIKSISNDYSILSDTSN